MIYFLIGITNKWTPANIHRIPPPPMASIISTVTSMNLICFCKAAKFEAVRLLTAVWLIANTDSSLRVRNSRQFPMTFTFLLGFEMCGILKFPEGSSINRVDIAGGGVFPKNPCLSTWEEGGVRGLSTWTKMFYGYPFCVHEFKCPFGVTVWTVTWWVLE